MVYCIYEIYTLNTIVYLDRFTLQRNTVQTAPELQIRAERRYMGAFMNIIITNSDGIPIYEQISAQIKAKILNGELKEGDALPSMRALAQDLRVSVITTKRAYETLENEGFIQSFTGRGSFVSAADPEMLKEQSLREIEEHLGKAAEIAVRSGVSLDELCGILRLFFE